MRVATGGTWDAQAWPRYFIAGSLPWVQAGSDTNTGAGDVLVALNEINSPENVRHVEQMLARGNNVFLDSGVFNLANQHARAHGLTMDAALSLAPDAIDGFDSLFKRYVEIARMFGDRMWGLVEIDQGGIANKRKTRARLEEMGIRPIPVYHPFNDGWDYFDELAERYDRICFGNVVQADQETRKRLVATAWERRRAYPKLWIHLLGLSPSAQTVAFPANSCDSSTWLSPLRWGSMPVWAATQSLWRSGDEFIYDSNADSPGERSRSAHKSCIVTGYNAGMVGRAMRRIADDQRRELGCDPGAFT